MTLGKNQRTLNLAKWKWLFTNVIRPQAPRELLWKLVPQIWPKPCGSSPNANCWRRLTSKQEACENDDNHRLSLCLYIFNPIIRWWGTRNQDWRFLNRPRGTVESVGNEFDWIRDFHSSVDFPMFIFTVLFSANFLVDLLVCRPGSAQTY